MTYQMRKLHPHKENVLLVNITRLGDMLQATPTIAGMKMENPECKITVLVEKQFAGICDYLPNIDETFALDLGMTVRSLSRKQEGIVDAYEYIEEVVEDLRSRDFDYCLNMSSSAYTALLLNLLGIKRTGGWNSDSEGYRVIETDWAKLFATSVFHQNRQLNSLNLVDVFRCSADVEQHPHTLVSTVAPEATEYIEKMIAEFSFTNKGPLIAIQAGASQGKRQWHPYKFSELIRTLHAEQDARILMTGTSKELPIIELALSQVDTKNVLNLAGKTNIAQLGAALKKSELLVTGDTGPMHMSVSVGTPVIAMFLASAYGFETGPYSEGNIVLQPLIGCGPCNPNKPCARPDCHDQISPRLVAHLVGKRLRSDFTSLEGDTPDSSNVMIYRSEFDEFGFCDLRQLNAEVYDSFTPYRDAYRKLWLSDIGGYPIEPSVATRGALSQVSPLEEGLRRLADKAEEGIALISRLQELVDDSSQPARLLGEVNERLTSVDRDVEEIGFHFHHLCPLSRMFIFAKENLSGTDALELASQMKNNYQTLKRRVRSFGEFLEG